MFLGSARIPNYTLGTRSRRRTHVVYPAMLTEIYIEALLVDEELADQVWEAWDASNVKSCPIVQLRSRFLIVSNRRICHRTETASHFSTAGNFFVIGITALNVNQCKYSTVSFVTN